MGSRPKKPRNKAAKQQERSRITADFGSGQQPQRSPTSWGAVANWWSPCRSATGSANARVAFAIDSRCLDRSMLPVDRASCRGATGHPFQNRVSRSALGGPPIDDCTPIKFIAEALLRRFSSTSRCPATIPPATTKLLGERSLGVYTLPGEQ